LKNPRREAGGKKKTKEPSRRMHSRFQEGNYPKFTTRRHQRSLEEGKGRKIKTKQGERVRNREPAGSRNGGVRKNKGQRSWKTKKKKFCGFGAGENGDVDIWAKDKRKKQSLYTVRHCNATNVRREDDCQVRKNKKKNKGKTRGGGSKEKKNTFEGGFEPNLWPTNGGAFAMPPANEQMLKEAAKESRSPGKKSTIT